MSSSSECEESTLRADFGLTKVRYNENGLIDELEVHPFGGELLQDPQLWIRVQLVGDMKKVLTFATLEHVEGLTYRWRDEVRQVIVEGQEYVSTDGEEKARDDLGSVADLLRGLCEPPPAR